MPPAEHPLQLPRWHQLAVVWRQPKTKFWMQPVYLGKDKDGKDIIWFTSYVFWVFEVDKEARILNKSLDDSDDGFANFRGCMSKLSSSTNNNAMRDEE